jgi:tetratricopeptide (TPR) repeat protein
LESHTAHGFTEKEKKGEDREAQAPQAHARKSPQEAFALQVVRDTLSSMSGKGRFEAAGRRARQIFLLLAGSALALTGFAALGAVADVLPTDAPETTRALDAKGQRKADALAWFINGLFEEESDGPEKALESYRKALALDPANTDLAIKVAYDYLRRGETAEAISVLKDAVKASPKETAPYLALSATYLRHLHKPELATKYAQAAIEIAPKSFAPYEALWEVYLSGGQTAKADQVLERAARSKSEDAEFWLALAELCSRNVLRDSAASLTEAELQRVGRQLEKAATFGENDPAVLSKIGDLYVLTRQTDKALPFYRKVVELRPSYPQIREKLAGCLIEAGQMDAAIEVIEDLVELNPLSIAAYDQLTQLYLKVGNQQKALASARQALLIEPQLLPRHLQVIDLLFKQKAYEGASAALEDARKRFPKAGLLTYYHAVALSQIKHHDEAMRAFEKALVEAGNSQPDMLNADFYFDYGAAAEQAGQYVKASELFRKSIELDPDNAARSYNYLGYMWVERSENLEEAGQLIRRALEMDPSNGAYVDSLGWLYFKQGKFQEAMTELLRAAELLPEPDPVVFEHIGDTFDKLGKNAEAVLYWQKALQLNPENKLLAPKLDKAAKNVAKQPGPNPPPSSQNPAH